jgi:Cysteine rich repeat
MNSRAIAHGCIDALFALSIASIAAPSFSADPAPAGPSEEMKAQARQIAQLCRADALRLCASVESGGGRKLKCLEEHKAELTPACRDALPKAEALKRDAMKQGVMPK